MKGNVLILFMYVFIYLFIYLFIFLQGGWCVKAVLFKSKQ